MNWLKSKKIIVTHSGHFHADDVFSVATIFLLPEFKHHKLVRTREIEKINQGDIVVDIGGIYNPDINRFDHHQTGGAGTDESGIPYCGFGLVWKKFGSKICDSEEVAKLVRRKLVKPIDAHDNGVSTYDLKIKDYSEYTLDDMIKCFNSSWNENRDENESFLEAVSLATLILKREIVQAKGKQEAYSIVEGVYNKTEDKRIIILDKYLPFQNVLMKYPEPLFVVAPHSVPGKWAVRAILSDEAENKNRKNFPKSWAGLRDSEMARVSGVKDAIFCHNALFLAAADSRKGAIELANLAINNKE